MLRTKNRIVKVAVMLVLLLNLVVGAAHAGERVTNPSGWYNSDYIFAATRGLNEMDAHPAVKVTLVPVTLVLDTACLPFALIIGLFGH
jgi:uncharacterized protein YceK